MLFFFMMYTSEMDIISFDSLHSRKCQRPFVTIRDMPRRRDKLSMGATDRLISERKSDVRLRGRISPAITIHSPDK